jgi:hypothetical protein
MQSPLSIDKDTVKKYKITKETELPPIHKLSFLQDQLSQIQQMQWRSRVDVMHATRLTESTNDTLKNKGHSNLAQHLNEVEQSTGAVEMLKKLIDELRAAYPELSVEG